MADDKKSLGDYGVHLFTGAVNEESTAEAIEFILEANLNGGHDGLKLIVNSGGGYVCSGFALIDVMAGSKIPVHTVGLGMIASMGVSIFIAGKKGTRTLTPNTMVMCHQWAGGAYGKHHELLADMKNWQQVQERMVAHYAKHTKLNKKKVEEIFFPPSDVWLNAKEAMSLGICDVIRDV